MHNRKMNADPHKDGSFHAENQVNSQENLYRLEFMVAFLLEKNEQFRQRLFIMGSEERY
jgi:hypothetical protein